MSKGNTMHLATRLLEEYASAWNKISEIALSIVSAESQGRDLREETAMEMVQSILYDFVMRTTALCESFELDTEALGVFLKAIVEQSFDVAKEVANALPKIEIPHKEER